MLHLPTLCVVCQSWSGGDLWPLEVMATGSFGRVLAHYLWTATRAHAIEAVNKAQCACLGTAPAMRDGKANLGIERGLTVKGCLISHSPQRNLHRVRPSEQHRWVACLGLSGAGRNGVAFRRSGTRQQKHRPQRRSALDKSCCNSRLPAHFYAAIDAQPIAQAWIGKGVSCLGY